MAAMAADSGTARTALAGGDALLVVDLQRDFLPGGALAVPQGDRVVGAVRDSLRLFARRQLPVFATRDWHPAHHCSFAAQGGQWPTHCVAGSAGAEFAGGIDWPAGTQIVSKGTDAAHEAYSGFAGTDLQARLRAAGVRRVFVAGLATDYCVRHTVMDALASGLAVVVLADAVAAVDARPGDGARALARMQDAGARVNTVAELGA